MAGSTNFDAQYCDGLSGTEANRECVIMAATDHSPFVAEFPYPNHVGWIYVNFLTLHILEQYELHGAPPAHSSSLEFSGNFYLDVGFYL